MEADRIAQRNQEAWKEALVPVGECHGKCIRAGEGHECFHRCPKPWAHFKDRCVEHYKIKGCHENCGHHDFACHMGCPKPDMKGADEGRRERHREKMREMWECHGRCGGTADQEDCHKGCKSSWAHLEARCQEGMKVKACFKGCGWTDWDCKRSCPQMDWGRRHEFQNGDDHEDGLDEALEDAELLNLNAVFPEEKPAPPQEYLIPQLNRETDLDATIQMDELKEQAIQEQIQKLHVAEELDMKLVDKKELQQELAELHLKERGVNAQIDWAKAEKARLEERRATAESPDLHV